MRNAIRRIQEKRKALSFTNCSQPTSFMPSQKSPSASWVHSLPTPSSPDCSEGSTPIPNSLIFKNERFKEDNAVCFSSKAENGNQVVQLTAFKPSGCWRESYTIDINIDSSLILAWKLMWCETHTTHTHKSFTKLRLPRNSPGFSFPRLNLWGDCIQLDTLHVFLMLHTRS